MQNKLYKTLLFVVSIIYNMYTLCPIMRDLQHTLFLNFISENSLYLELELESA